MQMLPILSSFISQPTSRLQILGLNELSLPSSPKTAASPPASTSPLLIHLGAALPLILKDKSPQLFTDAASWRVRLTAGARPWKLKRKLRLGDKSIPRESTMLGASLVHWGLRNATPFTWRRNILVFSAPITAAESAEDSRRAEGKRWERRDKLEKEREISEIAGPSRRQADFGSPAVWEFARHVESSRKIAGIG